MARLITQEEITAEGLPDYVDARCVFDDQTTGRHAAYVIWNDEAWLLWKHPDGQWVTWRKCTPQEVLQFTNLMGEAFHS